MSALGTKISRELAGKRIWQIGCIAFASVAIAEHFYDSGLATQPVRVVVVNGKNRIIAEADPVMMVHQEHVELATLAAQTMFGRCASSPDNQLGFNNPGVLRRLFNTPCQQQIESTAAKDVGVFRSQELTQMFEPTREIQEIARSESTVDMLVEGDVVQVGKIAGKAVPNSQPIRIRMRLQRNDDFATNHKNEMVVTAFDVSYLDAVVAQNKP